MGLFLIILLVISLVVDYIVALKFEKIAFQKGYDKSIHSFAMCFWLGIVGYLYVIALPNLKNSYNISGVELDKSDDNTSSVGHDNDINSNLQTKDPKKEKYDKLVAKAERFKDTFFDHSYRIRIYESIVKDMEVFANEDFEDSAIKLEEYRIHLELLKTKKIK